MDNPARKATLVGIAANAFLFAIKAVAGILSGSLALLSDALNSFSDTVYSIALFIIIRISQKKPDEDHPFGHHRAEPVAGMVIAIMMGILGFEIIKAGIEGLTRPPVQVFTVLGLVVLAVCMVLKTGMWLYFRNVGREANSPAIRASSVDCRNDVLISFTAMLGISGSLYGVGYLDCYAGIAIGAFIMWSGYKIATENVDYLMGKTPSKEIVDEIVKRSRAIKGVLGVHDVRAHYVGNYVHVQVHVVVDKKLNVAEAHDIGKKVQFTVEKMPSVDNAFIHLDTN